jgi:hypothetical protein
MASMASVAAVDPVRLLAEHTAHDVLTLDTTPAELREEHVAVVRLLSPGARPLPSVAAPGAPPHPFG